MLTSEDWAILRRSAILRDLPPADLAALVDERSVRSIERGHVLFQQGDPARAFFLVLGRVLGVRLAMSLRLLLA